jgi:hypothetical protein
MNTYFIIVALAQTHTSGATSAGLKQPGKIGGDWLFDLLTEPAPNNYAITQADCTAPMGLDVDSLSEVAGSPVGSTFKRDVDAHLFGA